MTLNSTHNLIIVPASSLSLVFQHFLNDLSIGTMESAQEHLG